MVFAEPGTKAVPADRMRSILGQQTTFVGVDPVVVVEGVERWNANNSVDKLEGAEIIGY